MAERGMSSRSGHDVKDSERGNRNPPHPDATNQPFRSFNRFPCAGARQWMHPTLFTSSEPASLAPVILKITGHTTQKVVLCVP